MYIYTALISRPRNLEIAIWIWRQERDSTG